MRLACRSWRSLRLERPLDRSRDGERSKKAGHDINDLRYIAQIIKESGRRLVIEDFHYMSVEQRKAFAFDLKALWDYGVFVVVIGVWSQSNMLIHLNPDLSGRIEELSIYWSDGDLDEDHSGRWGRAPIGVRYRTEEACHCRVLWQRGHPSEKLILDTLDELEINEACSVLTPVSDIKALESAEMSYADQLNPLYQQFAKRVSSGIRVRKDFTGIYAHAIAVILETDDATLMKGLPLDQIFQISNSRQPRIQKGNLRKVLEKFEELQVDDEGRGLVLSYNDATTEISVVDRQLLLYRRYSTVKWPWEDLIKEADASGNGSDDLN